MTVGRLIREISPREFVLWRIKFANDPWTQERADFRVAQVAAILANSNRDPQKRDKPFEVIDFMPFAKRKADAEKKEREENTVKVDPMTLTWMLHLSRKEKKRGQ